MLNLFIQLLLFLFHLYALLIQTANFRLQLENGLVLERVVTVFSVKLLNQGFQFFLLCLDVDRVALKVVVLLLLQLTVKFHIKLRDDVVQLLLRLSDSWILADESGHRILLVLRIACIK